jgi:hypothetical protein
MTDLADNVVTKLPVDGTFGNDSGAVTKCRSSATFGNYGIGFVRVRKRTLKGGHLSNQGWRRRAGILATAAMSFDVVRAARVNGKPRHQFVFGIGSIKNRMEKRDLAWFWLRALWRMERAGLDAEQRRALADEMRRKGATALTADQWRSNFGDDKRTQKEFPEILEWFSANDERAA